MLEGITYAEFDEIFACAPEWGPSGMFHRWVGLEATKIVQCGHCVASDVLARLSSPGAHRTLPDKVAAHTADVGVCAATLSSVVRIDVQKLSPTQCCAVALLQRRAQPTSGSCRCAGRTAYGALALKVLRLLMYSFVPGRSFSKKCCHTNGVDNGRQVSPSSPRASRRSDCTGPVSVLLPSTPIARALPVSAVNHTFCVTPYATRTRIGTCPV